MGRKLDVVTPASSEGRLIFFISSFQPQAVSLRSFLLPGYLLTEQTPACDGVMRRLVWGGHPGGRGRRILLEPHSA